MQSDIVIAVMGPTGSGKSNFINKLTGSKEETGANGLKSCTQDVREFRVSTPDGRKYVIADTPGFDDTTRSDRDILRLIADWLEKRYRWHVKLSGIIYMHRITDNRVSGSVCKNFDLFNRLCGDGAVKRIRLVTSMWDIANMSAARRRASELQASFWKPLIDEGAQYREFQNTRESAWGIIRDAIGESKAVLLQEELVDAKRRLNETSAAQAIYSRFQRLLKEQRDSLEQLAEEAKSQQDPVLARELEEESRKIEAQLQKTWEQMEQMKIPFLRRLFLIFSKKPRSHVIEVDIPSPEEENVNTYAAR